ncbi:MAG: hypothetical protein HKN12_08360, partial [Gemmatimonadetes bacterium]|nr:hypothetical protein [Gemmatimonadota bacterium]
MKRFRVPVLLVLLLMLCVPPASADSVQEDILLSKYRRGDYAFYVSWHDPWGAAFDEHASFAWPIGGKVRFRVGSRYRVELDFSYYQQGGQVQPFISTAISPGFDGVMVGAVGQVFLRNTGMIRPYVGGGPMFVSLSNDLNVEFRNIPDDILVAERFQIATWTKLDLGLQTVVGVDIPMGQRAFPF